MLRSPGCNKYKMLISAFFIHLVDKRRCSRSMYCGAEAFLIHERYGKLCSFYPAKAFHRGCYSFSIYIFGRVLCRVSTISNKTLERELPIGNIT